MEARQGLQNRGRNVILKRLTIAHSSRNFIRSIEAHRGKGNSSNKPVSILLAACRENISQLLYPSLRFFVIAVFTKTVMLYLRSFYRSLTESRVPSLLRPCPLLPPEGSPETTPRTRTREGVGTVIGSGTTGTVRSIPEEEGGEARRETRRRRRRKRRTTSQSTTEVRK